MTEHDYTNNKLNSGRDSKFARSEVTSTTHRDTTATMNDFGDDDVQSLKSMKATTDSNKQRNEAVNTLN